MLRTTKTMKDKYEIIQNYIFSLIPEKWEEIYLYASVEGEIFFYYMPKGILKRRAVNVYEVPQRFNINEEQYLKIVEKLCKKIKSLKEDFKNTDQEIWSSLTISIANCRFKIEYNYGKLPKTEQEVFKRNTIWKFKYLKIGGENKEERKVLEEYFLKQKPGKTENYETGLYMKTENNKIEFGKEDVANREFVIYEKDDFLSLTNNIKRKFTKNGKEIIGPAKSKEKHKKIRDNEKKEINEKINISEKPKKKLRNQILD